MSKSDLKEWDSSFSCPADKEKLAKKADWKYGGLYETLALPDAPRVSRLPPSRLLKADLKKFLSSLRGKVHEHWDQILDEPNHLARLQALKTVRFNDPFLQYVAKNRKILYSLSPTLSSYRTFFEAYPKSEFLHHFFNHVSGFDKEMLHFIYPPAGLLQGVIYAPHYGIGSDAF